MSSYYFFIKKVVTEIVIDVCWTNSGAAVADMANFEIDADIEVLLLGMYALQQIQERLKMVGFPSLDANATIVSKSTAERQHQTALSLWQ